MKYNQIPDLKLEINNYVSMLNKDSIFKDESKIRAISKYILFLKQLGSDSHYKRAMIYDLLCLMNSLTNNSKRNFYQTYRSFIENFIRFILKLDDTDNTGVRELFKNLKDHFNHNNDTDRIINYLNGEYGKCCNYVHSNIEADMKLFQYYKDILESDEMNHRTIVKLVNSILTLLKTLTNFILITSPLLVDSSFFRYKSELKFLIGEKNFKLFQFNMEEVAG